MSRDKLETFDPHFQKYRNAPSFIYLFLFISFIFLFLYLFIYLFINFI